VGYEFRLRRSFAFPVDENDTTWKGFTPAEVDLIDRTAIRNTYPPGDAVFHQNDKPAGIFCIEDGYVLMSRLDTSGNETTFGIFGPNETMGHRSFFAFDLHVATARAITHCSVYLIPPHTVRRLLESNPDLAWWFLRTVASDRGPLDGLLLRGSKVSVRTRFFHMLLLLRDRFAETDALGQLIYDLPLSRGEIANMLSVTPETVARTVRDLQDENIAIFQGRRKVIVPKPEILDLASEADGAV